MADQSIDVAANLAALREQIGEAAQKAGRSPQQITLVAVSKTKPVALIQQALAAGQHDFGENRVEEAWEKFADPGSPAAIGNLPAAAGAGFNLHLIGPIQSRKAALAVACQPALIHAIDRLKIARRLDQFASQAGQALEVLLEINVSGEESKFGFSAQDALRAVDDLLALSHLRVRGLMTMPPYDPDPEAARPYFVKLRQLRDELASRRPEGDWSQLSIGMSHDFAVAIQEGATLVRVGAAVFGSRL